MLGRFALAVGLTIAVSGACAKHEKAPPAASSNAAATAPTTAPAAAPEAAPDAAVDPKEAARATGLLGPTDQGAFADDFESGSAVAKPNANAKDSHIDSAKRLTPGVKTLAPSTRPSRDGAEKAGQSAADLGKGEGGGGGGTRGPESINGSVAITEISAGDDAAKDPVRAAVAKHLGAIEACYRQTLARAPAVTGKYHVVFFVDPDGTFERAAQLSSELGDGLLGDCIIRTVNGIKLDHQLSDTQPIKVGVILSFKHT